jgi:hypothetical protein
MSSLSPSTPASSQPPSGTRPISAWGYVWRVGGALLLLLVLVVGGLLFYASTPHFPTRCGRGSSLFSKTPQVGAWNCSLCIGASATSP